MDDERFILSKYLQIVPLQERWLVAHGPRLKRMLLEKELFDNLMRFAPPGCTATDFAAGYGGRLDALAMFRRAGFVVPVGQDEDPPLREELERQILSSSFAKSDRWNAPMARSFGPPGEFSDAEPQAVAFLVIGGCLSQLACDAIEALGPKYGITPTATSAWPTGEVVRNIPQADVIVFQPGVNEIVSPVWDHFAFIDSVEKRRRLHTIEQFLSERLGRLTANLRGKLLLVHGFAKPQMPPAGRSDFRLDPGLAEAIDQLNRHIIRRIAPNPNAFYIDEERIAATHGKRYLLDDMLLPYSHRGPVDFGERDSPGTARVDRSGGRPHFAELLAHEYLACYSIWKGRGQVKCVVVDLDNTLWRGVAGEDELHVDHLSVGIHEALLILKSRGVLLATCSRNDEGAAISAWKRLLEHRQMFLRPEDFVLHRINYRAKTENVADIIGVLGLGSGAVAFIDDHPVEREAIRQAFPGMLVLGEEVDRVREEFLTNPRFEPSMPSAEAVRRTEMVQGQLRRDALRREAPDANAFLRSIQVRLRVTRLTSPRHLPRVVELLQRSNQYNTTLVRYDVPTLKEHIAQADGAIYAVAAADKFVDYGLVGACVLNGAVVETLAVSCRALVLDVGPAFLTCVLRASGLERKAVIGRLVAGPRNQPAQGLFSTLGFAREPEGEYRLRPGDLRPSGEALHDILVVEESELYGGAAEATRA